MPFSTVGQYFDEFEVGQQFSSHGRTLTEADLVTFCGFLGDYEEPHANEEFAKAGPLGRRVMQGCLVTTVAEGLMSRTGLFDGTAITLLASSWEYKAPVYIGDTIHSHLSVRETRASSKGGRGVVTFDFAIRNQSDDDVTTGTYVMMFKAKD